MKPAKPKRFFVKRGSNGVTKIRRIDYKASWPETAKAVKARDGNKCRGCSGTKELEVHHIIPLSKGGTNAKTNLITLCERCHTKRHRHL